MDFAKKAKLTYREVANAISNRTGLPDGMVRTFIDAYSDITKEALLAQVEVPFGTVCTFTWRQVNPRENVKTWNYTIHDFNEPTAVPGFQKTTIKVNKTWAKELREATEFNVGEENPASGGFLEYNTDDTDEIEEEENDEYQCDADNE